MHTVQFHTSKNTKVEYPYTHTQAEHIYKMRRTMFTGVLKDFILFFMHFHYPFPPFKKYLNIFFHLFFKQGSSPRKNSHNLCLNM